MKIVVDSNIFFSALLSAENKSKTVFFNPQYECHTCNFRVCPTESISNQA